MIHRWASTVDGLLVASDQAAVVFGGTVGLESPESLSADFTIVVVLHGSALVVAHEEVLLVVARAEEVEHARVRTVADCLQDHEVALLDRNEADVLHSLDERQGATVGLAGLIMQVHVQRVLVVQVVAGPELHGEGPGNQVLRVATPDERAVGEQARSALLVEVAVAEHR